MIKRVISGVIGAALMIAVLLFGGRIGVAALMALIAAVAVFELLRAAEFGWRDRLPAMVLAAAAPLLLLWNTWAPVVAAAVYLLAVMIESVVRHDQLPPERAGLLVLLPAVAVSGFTAVAALRNTGEDGLFYVFLALVIPWLSDTGAYFTGVLFGKHKLCPVISPKKTVEGLIGGIVLSLLAAGLTGWLYMRWCGHSVEMRWLSLLLVAAIGAPLSVFGDLFASVVKRRFGVKDYGTIMPGHGGVMDRFDSVLPVSLLLLLWVQMWPLIGAPAAG